MEDSTMTEEERRLEILKLITSAEQHFNHRALASTWFLATMAGVGWILKDLPAASGEQAGLLIDKGDLLLVLCLGGSIGIFVLWILDIRVYQQMTNVWFDARKQYEVDDVFPTIRNNMKRLFQTGRATELIIIYYLALTAAPLLMAMLIAYWGDQTFQIWLVAGILVAAEWMIYQCSPKDKEWMRHQLETEQSS